MPSKRGQVNQAETLERAERMAVTIAVLPVQQWPGWIKYILELLDGQTDPGFYGWFLERLDKEIAARLKEGRW
jgi:hypothetical protein